MQKSTSNILIQSLFLVIVPLLLLFSGCNKGPAIDQIDKLQFHNSIYHPSWFFSRERNDTIEKYIYFEFNEYAVQENSYATLQFLDQKGEPILNKSDIKVFVEGNSITNGEFEIKSRGSKNNVKISFLLPTDYSMSWWRLIKNKKKHFNGYIKYLGGDLDRINNLEEPTTEPFMIWEATQIIKMNPLQKSLSWLLIIALLSIAFWKTILNPIIYPKIKRQSIVITSPYFKTIKTKGLLQLTLTNQKTEKQKLLNRFFKGRKEIYVHPFFTHPIYISYKSKKSARIKLGRYYSLKPYSSELKVQHTYLVINNETKEKITIS